MKYNIWLEPYMPNKEDVERGVMYLPQSHLEDEELTLLCKQVYLLMCIKEQLEVIKYKNISEIVEDIKTHPDKDNAALNEYLESTGKDIDNLTDKEWDNLPKYPLTIKDVEDSLDKLVSGGYIETK